MKRSISDYFLMASVSKERERPEPPKSPETRDEPHQSDVEDGESSTDCAPTPTVTPGEHMAASTSGEQPRKKTDKTHPRPSDASPVESNTADAPPAAPSTSAGPPAKKTKTYSFNSDWLTHEDFKDWLRVTRKDGKIINMYCWYCRACGPSLAGATTFVQGHTLFKRESLVKHAGSKAHDRCKAKYNGPQQGSSTIQVAFQRQSAGQQSQVEAELVKKFNTAYMVGKEELPFTKFKSLLQLQKKNGLSLNDTNGNDIACAKFLKTISDTLKENTADRIAASTFLSFMIDGDRDVSIKECEIVYARILEDGKPKNLLVGHVEVEHAHAQVLFEATKAAFASLGEPCQNWLEKTVAMTADGANVNLGRKGGVIVHVKEAAGNHVVPFHCMPHRLELALLSVQKNTPMVSTLYAMLDMVFRTYHDSAKSRRELKKLGEELGVTVLNPSAVKGTRWLPHVSRALNVLLKPGKKDGEDEELGQYTAVCMHMHHLAEASKNADIKGRARKVKETMEDGTFVAFCHFLADMFDQVSSMCLLMQKNDVILPKAVAKLEELILTVEAMKEQPLRDGRLASFQKSVQDQRWKWERDHPDAELPVVYYYQEVELKKGEADKIAMDEPISTAAPTLQRHITRTVTATVDHIKSRFSSLLGMDYEQDPARKAVHFFCLAFNPDQWPDSMDELLVYGEEYVDFLLNYFQDVLNRTNCDVQRCQDEFRSMKMAVRRAFNKDKSYNDLYEALLTKEPHCTDYKNILHLVSIMLVLPISSAQCERGFSAQRRIKGSTRASLAVSRVEDLIRISADGPTLHDFDALPAVRKYLHSGTRSRRPDFRRPGADQSD